MKLRHFPILAVPVFLGSCDHIDAVGDKVNELKDVRKVSKEDVDLKAVTEKISKTGSTVQDLAETEFDAFIAEPGRLNIVDYQADWCPPCRVLEPILTEIAEANAGTVRLGIINVDHAKEMAHEQGVRGIPDVRFYVDGKLVHKFVGAPPKAEVERLVAIHSASVNPVQALTGTPESADGKPTATAPPKRPANAKPLEEAMKPMDKNWLPPGVIPRK